MSQNGNIVVFVAINAVGSTIIKKEPTKCTFPNVFEELFGNLLMERI